jgi:hypothetical protein
MALLGFQGVVALVDRLFAGSYAEWMKPAGLVERLARGHVKKAFKKKTFKPESK